MTRYFTRFQTSPPTYVWYYPDGDSRGWFRNATHNPSHRERAMYSLAEMERQILTQAGGFWELAAAPTWLIGQMEPRSIVAEGL